MLKFVWTNHYVLEIVLVLLFKLATFTFKALHTGHPLTSGRLCKAENQMAEKSKGRKNKRQKICR